MERARPVATRLELPAKTEGRAIVAVAVLLVLGGLGVAAWNHPDGFLEGLLDASARVAFWAVVLLGGARLAAWATGSRLAGLAHVVWDGAAGLVVLTVVLLVVGLVPHGFEATTVRVTLAAFVGAAALRARLDPLARFRERAAPDVATRRFALALLAVAMAGLVWDRVPPVFFDARAYHFAQPELWLIEGRIAPAPWSLHSWFPPGMSVLYGAGLATGGEAWANDANVLVGLCLLAAVFDLGRRWLGSGAGLLAVLVLLSLPLTLYALAIPAADLGHGMFACASLGCLLLLRSTGHRCWLARAALLGAGAVLTKYLGLLVPVALGALWLAARPGSTDGRHALRGRIGSAVRFSGPPLVLVLPWLLANLVTVGNPVAPVASSVFPTSGLADGGAASFRADAGGGPPGWADARNLLPRWVTGSETESRIYPTPAWGWVPIVLAPLALVAARADPRVRATLVLALALITVWFLTFRWERFLVAASAFLALSLAGAIVVTWRRGGALRVLPVLALPIAAASIAVALIHIERFTGGARVAAGLESPRQLVARAFPSTRLYDRAAELLDAGADRVLLVGDMRHYGLAVRRAAPTGFNTHPLIEALERRADPEQVHRELRDRGFTHLIVDPGWVARSAEGYPSLAPAARDPEIVRRYVASLGAPLATEGSVVLFRIPG